MCRKRSQSIELGSVYSMATTVPHCTLELYLEWIECQHRSCSKPEQNGLHLKCMHSLIEPCPAPKQQTLGPGYKAHLIFFTNATQHFVLFQANGYRNPITHPPRSCLPSPNKPIERVRRHKRANICSRRRTKWTVGLALTCSRSHRLGYTPRLLRWKRGWQATSIVGPFITRVLYRSKRRRRRRCSLHRTQWMSPQLQSSSSSAAAFWKRLSWSVPGS